MNQIDTNLFEIKRLLGLEADPQDKSIKINNLASLGSARSGSVTFCTERMKLSLNSCKASVLICKKSIADYYQGNARLVEHKDPRYAFAILLEKLCFEDPKHPGIDPQAVCHPSAKISKNATIAANAVIGESVEIEDNVYVGSNTYIGKNSKVASGTYVHANVSIYHDVVIGKDCIIHCGSVIGSDGFGYVRSENGWKKILHIGRVILGDNVEIGANTCIDRGMLDDTEIHSGSKLDNLIHIAHNVVIGENAAMAACSGIAGSTKVGKNFCMGGNSGLNGQITVTDNVVVGGGTNIMKSIDSPGFYIGVMPAQKQKDWARSAIAIKKASVKKSTS